MNSGLLNLLLNSLIVLGITVVIFSIWFVIWSMILLPIRKKDAILKERDEARKELQQIQAAKGIEWDQYKEVVEENDKLRKAYFKAKEDLDKVKGEVAKAEIARDKLFAKNKELNDQLKEKKDSKIDI